MKLYHYTNEKLDNPEDWVGLTTETSPKRVWFTKPTIEYKPHFLYEVIGETPDVLTRDCVFGEDVILTKISVKLSNGVVTLVKEQHE